MAIKKKEYRTDRTVLVLSVKLMYPQLKGKHGMKSLALLCSLLEYISSADLLHR